MTASTTTTAAAETAPLGADVESTRRRLLDIRDALSAERETAGSPALARALDLAETYLYLGLGYLGHCDDLFPEEGASAVTV